MSGWSLKGKRELNTFDPSKELVPLTVGRTERRRGKKAEKQEGEKLRKERRREWRKTEKRQKRKKEGQEETGHQRGSFCREKHQRSNASLPPN